MIFLAVSGLLLLALLWWASEVLLPFVLALIIAYVLTPLVALFERVRMPRSLAIITVYALTFALIYVFVAVIAPRVYSETLKLVRDTPQLVDDLAHKWGPRVDAWVQGLLERTDRSAPPPEPVEGPALEILPREDGGFAVEVRRGVDLVQEGPRRWKVTPIASEAPDTFRVEQVASDAVAGFFAYLKKNALELIKFGQVVVSMVARGVFLLFMTLMVAGYVMHTRESILGFFRSLPPPRSRPSFDRLLARMDRGLAGVVRGQLLICLVNGVLTAIGLWMFELKYWPILAIIAAVMSLIPIFGSILSTIPAVAIGLTQDFWTALWVLLWIVGIHQVEANLLNPKIIGVAAKIHPVLVVFALIVGEHFFGLWGALLAVPALSLTQSVFNHFRFESLPDAGPDSLLPPAPMEPLSTPGATPVPRST